VSSLDAYVAATVSLDELLHVVLPMTGWWKDSRLQEVSLNPDSPRKILQAAVLARLTGIQSSAFLKPYKSNLPLAKQLYDAAAVLGLIGTFISAKQDPAMVMGLPGSAQEPNAADAFLNWLSTNARRITKAVYDELLERGLQQGQLAAAKKSFKAFLEQSQVVQRVFMDRSTSLSDFDALGTIKADAATRLFDISCKTVTWGIVDAGIDGTHPAFLDHDAKDAAGKLLKNKPSRVRRTFNFTRVELIRSFDLTIGTPGSPERNAEVQRVIDELNKVPGRKASKTFTKLATDNLNMIGVQLEHGLDPDWALIEPLVELEAPDPAVLSSDHGTHVAGTLGADWRDKLVNADKRHVRKLVGVCPDINIYDLRVIHEQHHDSVESAVIAALDFVRYLNAKSGTNEAILSGVNISLSIPHDVRAYGCGATPVCVASDRLSDSGVVVVVAAGNRGWSERELGFGQFMFCSVTDPGNAHNVITVGSTHRLKPHLYGVSFFSSRGPTGDGRTKPDVVAPGEKIRGPVRGAADALQDGTSMAAPFVSGAAAMLLARHKELQGHPERVKQILCDTATDLGREKYFQGHGLVDILRALQSI
jgi:subtilisin family serine protease